MATRTESGQRSGGSGRAGAVALGLVGLATASAASWGSGCGNTVVTTTGSSGSMSSGSSTSTGMMPPPGPADKVDVVLMVDNSASMSDKQRLLATAVPALLTRLINPRCVDANGGAATMQPTDPSMPCPGGCKRELTPVTDLNIGIVDSSLGGMGSDACPDNASGYFNNDHGHLVARSKSGQTKTYMDEGFIAWDAKGTRGGITDLNTLETSIGDLVLGVGENGCGYEQPLEAVIRFLADPSPYASLSKNGTTVTPTGVDQALLTQRGQFLRPDSLLLVVMLTDENDFSINFLGPEDYLPWNSSPFYRASSACATNPADKCCYSCGLSAPAGCQPKSSDASCAQNGGLYTPQQDGINTKESQAKKKYGFDPNFPVERYVNALTQATIDPTRPDFSTTGSKSAVPNPIYASSGPGKSRDPSFVFFAAIVGVPYQAVANDPTDLSKGLKNFDQLTASGFWTADVGDPSNYVAPTDPIMQESTAKRPGIPAGAPNGGDRSLDPNAPNDIQYTCIFPLSTPNPQGTDCLSPDSLDNPLCSPGGKEPQLNAKAYPGLRELAVVHGLAGQGVASSICPQNSMDPSSANFGYGPAVNAIVERVKTRLGG